MNSPVKRGMGGGMQMKMMGPGMGGVKENVQPAKTKFTFQVIDYEKPGENTAGFSTLGSGG